ncbi:MAG: hypothetical protein JNK87_41475 [Bryobacterales bacterium]|nr:hypothetical protein [Bryobacterales bacterium]
MGDGFNPNTYQDPGNRVEEGRAGFDARHRMVANFTQGGSLIPSNRIGSGVRDNPTVNQWFYPKDCQLVSRNNTAIAERCKYGNSGMGILEGPGFKNVDFSLFKNFTITERVRLPFRQCVL